MPKANWGISAGDVDGYDRSSQYAPYDGPVPVNGVYKWRVKRLLSIAPTGTRLPQLRVGLELVPRTKEEKQYAGYYITAFLPVSERTAFRYVPFLDAIGVSGREFESGTIIDEEGNIKKIGKFRFDPEKTYIKGQLKDDTDGQGNPRKDIGWMGAPGDDAASYVDDDEDDEFDGDDIFVDDEDDEDDDGDDEWD